MSVYTNNSKNDIDSKQNDTHVKSKNEVNMNVNDVSNQIETQFSSKREKPMYNTKVLEKDVDRNSSDFNRQITQSNKAYEEGISHTLDNVKKMTSEAKIDASRSFDIAKKYYDESIESIHNISTEWIQHQKELSDYYRNVLEDNMENYNISNKWTNPYNYVNINHDALSELYNQYINYSTSCMLGFSNLIKDTVSSNMSYFKFLSQQAEDNVKKFSQANRNMLYNYGHKHHNNEENIQ